MLLQTLQRRAKNLSVVFAVLFVCIPVVLIGYFIIAPNSSDTSQTIVEKRVEIPSPPQKCVEPNSDLNALANAKVFQDRWLDLIKNHVLGISLRTIELQMTNYDLKDGEDPKQYWKPFDINKRQKGEDWPVMGLSMIGEMRMNNVGDLVRRVIKNNVPGDVMEAGIWRGGTLMYMKALLDALDPSRHVYGADSFRGIPLPRNGEKHGDHERWNSMAWVRVSRHDVEENFRAFGLLDDRVHFCEGLFVDTLPTCGKDRKFAIVRADGDMYESTSDIIWNMYSRMSVGGYFIMDDYHFGDVQRAVDDFHKHNNIPFTLYHVGDGNGVYWQKTADVDVDMKYYEDNIKN